MPKSILEKIMSPNPRAFSAGFLVLGSIAPWPDSGNDGSDAHTIPKTLTNAATVLNLAEVRIE